MQPAPVKHREGEKKIDVNFNLRLRIQQKEIEREEKELDHGSMMMDVALFDEDNPIMELLNHSMSESIPLLDEEDEPT